MSYHPNHGSGLQTADLPLGVFACAVSSLDHLARESALSWCWLMKDLVWEAVDQGFSPCCLSSSRKVSQACIYGSNMSEAAGETGPGEQLCSKALLLSCL